MPSPANATVSCDGEAPRDPADIELIAPDRPVPAFVVATADCKMLRSSELIGERPLVLVFFSSWCGVCERKLPLVRRAAEALAGQATFVGVALDDDETWDKVPEYVARHGLDFPIVRGARFRSFSLGYDPFQSVPVVVIVGRDGTLVDLQIGHSPFDYNRLVGAVEVGKKEP